MTSSFCIPTVLSNGSGKSNFLQIYNDTHFYGVFNSVINVVIYHYEMSSDEGLLEFIIFPFESNQFSCWQRANMFRIKLLRYA